MRPRCSFESALPHASAHALSASAITATASSTPGSIAASRFRLLRYFRSGAVPNFANADAQARVLRPLARFLELEGWKVTTEETGALRCEGQRAMTVGVHPALVASDAAEADHPTVAPPGAPRVLLPDYLVEHDLPSAYQRATGLTAAVAGASNPPPTTAPANGRVVSSPSRSCDARTRTPHTAPSACSRMSQTSTTRSRSACRAPV